MIRYVSTTASKRTRLSGYLIDKKPEVHAERLPLVFRNRVLKDARSVTTSSSPNNTRAPGIPEPPLVASDNDSFLDVRIPPPEMAPESPIQVPYVPDFWDSAKLTPNASLAEVPKVVVVGGTETSHGSAYTQSLEDINMPLESDSTQTSQKTEPSDSFLDDIAEELHLPPIQEIKSSIYKIFS